MASRVVKACHSRRNRDSGEQRQSDRYEGEQRTHRGSETAVVEGVDQRADEKDRNEDRPIALSELALSWATDVAGAGSGSGRFHDEPPYPLPTPLRNVAMPVLSRVADRPSGTGGTHDYGRYG